MKTRPKTAAPRLHSVKHDYAGIIKQIVEDEYLPSALEWVTKVNDKEKQGLKIIAAVIKHRGNKKFRVKPKESVMSLAHKSLNSNSLFSLNKENLEKFRQEYKQNLYKSAYGLAFGRKETDVADTNVLTYKKFEELQSAKVLNKTSKGFLSKWSQSGEDSSYVSLAILVIKGIFTYWKQNLPKDTVSHMMHTWYDPHEKTHLDRMDQVGKSLLIRKINNVQQARPQTTGSNAYARKRKSDTLLRKGQKKGRGLDHIIEDRKKFLLRGNGNVTGFFDPPEGMITTYQNAFKACKSTKAFQNTNGHIYTSSIMTVTPDPGYQKKQTEKADRLRADLTSTFKKLSNTDSVFLRAMNRAVDYQQNEDIAQHMKFSNGPIKMMNAGNAGLAYRNRNQSLKGFLMEHKTPMPIRVQNLMGPE